LELVVAVASSVFRGGSVGSDGCVGDGSDGDSDFDESDGGGDD
jgi:hypothetical protein